MNRYARWIAIVAATLAGGCGAPEGTYRTIDSSMAPDFDGAQSQVSFLSGASREVPAVIEFRPQHRAWDRDVVAWEFTYFAQASSVLQPLDVQQAGRDVRIVSMQRGSYDSPGSWRISGSATVDLGPDGRDLGIVRVHVDPQVDLWFNEPEIRIVKRFPREGGPVRSAGSYSAGSGPATMTLALSRPHPRPEKYTIGYLMYFASTGDPTWALAVTQHADTLRVKRHRPRGEAFPDWRIDRTARFSWDVGAPAAPEIVVVVDPGVHFWFVDPTATDASSSWCDFGPSIYR